MIDKNKVKLIHEARQKQTNRRIHSNVRIEPNSAEFRYRQSNFDLIKDAKMSLQIRETTINENKSKRQKINENKKIKTN